MDQLAEITGIQPKHGPFAATQVFEPRGENFAANSLVEGSMSVLENKRDRKKPSSINSFTYQQHEEQELSGQMLVERAWFWAHELPTVLLIPLLFRGLRFKMFLKTLSVLPSPKENITGNFTWPFRSEATKRTLWLWELFLQVRSAMWFCTGWPFLYHCSSHISQDAVGFYWSSC